MSEFFKKLTLHELPRRVQFRFLKNSQVQITFQNEREKPYDYLLIIWTWKNSREAWLWTLFSVLWARLTAGGFNYHAIRKKLRHPGRALDLKIKDLIGYLWTSLFIDQSECLLYYLFLHSITSFLHCVREKLHCSQPIRIE